MSFGRCGKSGKKSGKKLGGIDIRLVRGVVARMKGEVTDKENNVKVGGKLV